VAAVLIAPDASLASAFPRLDFRRYFHNIGIVESKEAVKSLEALAQASRLGIFRLLVEAGPAGVTAGRIAEHMGLPAPTLSFHLSQLKHAGLVACQRNGRSLIYSANFDAMNSLVGFLTKNCCAADPALCRSTRGVAHTRHKR
jgi:ArsR family transcriptional regulator, arsenate/arsenite/antimonite-responsive transcriptional repressor